MQPCGVDVVNKGKINNFFLGCFLMKWDTKNGMLNPNNCMSDVKDKQIAFIYFTTF